MAFIYCLVFLNFSCHVSVIWIYSPGHVSSHWNFYFNYLFQNVFAGVTGDNDLMPCFMLCFLGKSHIANKFN